MQVGLDPGKKSNVLRKQKHVAAMNNANEPMFLIGIEFQPSFTTAYVYT